MMRNSRIFLAVVVSVVFFSSPIAFAYYVWSPAEGKFISPENQTQKTAEEQYTEALRLRTEGKTDQMVHQLRALVRTYPLSAHAPEAQFLIATTLEEQGKPERAASELQKLIHDFPQSNQVDQAVERLYKLGIAFLGGQKQKVLGVPILPSLPKAVQAFQFIVANAPYGAYGDQAQFQLGIAHRKMGHYGDAVSAFQKLIDDYPSSTLLDDTHYQLAEASYERSQSANRDQQALSSAADHLQQFIQQYRTGTLAERAQVLKRQIDEQDAEKNYRIGLYYEKQGFVESALIYYEDVANRYGETPFGQKAHERYQALAQPAKTISKDKTQIEKRLAEVDSLLVALKQEEDKKDLTPERISEVAAMRGQLDEERASLQLAEKQFQRETKTKFIDRKKLLRSREKTLRAKFKTFEKRKKELGAQPSVELVEVFERWHQSLLNEQNELAEERNRLGLAGAEMKAEKAARGGPKTKSIDKLLRFEEKKWASLDAGLQKLTGQRKAYEEEYGHLEAEQAALDREEFRLAQTTQEFKTLLPVEFATKTKKQEAHRQTLAQKQQAFEEAKKQFIDQYGLAAFSALLVATEGGVDVSLIHDSSELEKTLQGLQSEKKSLGEDWLRQKEKVDSIAKALGIGSGTHSAVTTAEDQGDADKEARMLKKRMKYLEREIRRRLDQIQDWQSENETRMHRLDELLHPKSNRSGVEKAVGTVVSPATGFYKLTKIFLFGLPNRDQQLNHEAREKLLVNTGKESQENLDAVRELQEEIELQSILIQGRANEIKDMKTELDRLREESKRYPNFEYQSMLVDRFPTALEYSVESAEALFAQEDSKRIFQERYDSENRKFTEIENRLKEVDRKIIPVSDALTALRRETAEEAAKQAELRKDVNSDVGRLEAVISQSSKPAVSKVPSAAQSTSPEVSEERSKLEADLVRRKTEVKTAEAAVREEEKKLDQEIFEWYRDSSGARTQIQSALSGEGKNVLTHSAGVSARRKELQKLLFQTAGEEKKQAESASSFLGRKLETLEKRLEGLKRPSADLEGALNQEIRETTELKNRISTDINYLDSSFKK